MPRWLAFGLFLTVVLSLTALVHRYLWARLVRDVAWPAPWHRRLTWVVIGLWLLLALGMPLTRVLAGQASQASAASPELAGALGRGALLVPYVWMGTMFLLLVAVLAVDLTRAGVSGWDLLRGNGHDPERRLTLARMGAGAAALVAGGASVEAVRQGLTRLIVKRVDVTLGRLPAGLHGTRIVQLTDLHIGHALQRAFVEQVVARANALEPDVIAITGDLVDGSVEALRQHVAPLAELRARWGVYFVTGNHEYYSGVEPWCAELERLGITVLRNRRVSVGDARGSFDLCGVDDWSARRSGHTPPDLAGALAARDPARELVLLAHQPKAVHEAAAHGVGLQLSGHTHGGQLWPWSALVRLDQPVVSGLARFGETQVYVSNGTGYWGPPMRLGAPAEITEIVLGARDAGAA